MITKHTGDLSHLFSTMRIDFELIITYGTYSFAVNTEPVYMSRGLFVPSLVQSAFPFNKQFITNNLMSTISNYPKYEYISLKISLFSFSFFAFWHRKFPIKQILPSFCINFASI